MTDRPRLAVRLTKDAMRQVRAGHPWVFDRSITQIRPEGEGEAGDLAVVFDDKRRFSAIGLYDPDSPIRIKLLHHGAPVQVGPELWDERLQAALALRASLVASTHTDAFRWVNGENDAMPGLVLDVYRGTVVMKLYTEAWFPYVDEIVDAVVRARAPERIVLRLSRTVASAQDRWHDGTALVGTLPDGPVRFLENDLTFEADVVAGQKTGHFLDQRENRLLVRGLSGSARVLDVYACTGGFSVNAAAGGARLVHSVDISAAAIETTRRNMAANRDRPAVRACRHHWSVGDAMTVMAEMIDERRTFDVVVVDPPSFARRRSQVEGALRAYARLTRLALDLVEPGGVLVQASCSSRVTTEEFHATVLAAADESDRRLIDVLRTGHAADHPIGFPEGEYLKGIIATVGAR
ncbi:MAG: class I SAM-dependent rRNA methyltransferase [Actinomycetota bacterium]|nr:class I SAM-dependent rRNA methyltransferase [Actinomycetota bacterium]